jgi:hypothetical protein
MSQRRRALHPITRLALAFRAAAFRIDIAAVRRIAAYDAERIPVSKMEMGRHPKAEMARTGRRLLKALPTIAPEEWEGTRITLRACADAITSRFEETDVQMLGKPRRRFMRIGA